MTRKTGSMIGLLVRIVDAGIEAGWRKRAVTSLFA
jgi:hypothetical protein